MLSRCALLIVKHALTHGQGLTASLGKKPILLVAKILPCKGKRLLNAPRIYIEGLSSFQDGTSYNCYAMLPRCWFILFHWIHDNVKFRLEVWRPRSRSEKTESVGALRPGPRTRFMLSSLFLFSRVWNAFWERASSVTNQIIKQIFSHLCDSFCVITFHQRFLRATFYLLCLQ